MKVLVTGAKGQLGADLMNELKKRGLDSIGVDVEEMDITDKDACMRVIGQSGADALCCIYCSRCCRRQCGAVPENQWRGNAQCSSCLPGCWN